MPPSKAVHNNRRDRRQVVQTTGHDKCEICRNPASDYEGSLCIHAFCRKCLSKFNACPTCGNNLDQSQSVAVQRRDEVPTRVMDSTYNLNNQDPTRFAQSTVTTTTETTHTTTESVPQVVQPVRQNGHNGFGGYDSRSDHSHDVQNHSYQMQKTTSQVRALPRGLTPIYDAVGELTIDSRRMIAAMSSTAGRLRPEYYIDNYARPIEDICKSWSIALQRRDGLRMLKLDYLQISESSERGLSLEGFRSIQRYYQLLATYFSPLLTLGAVENEMWTAINKVAPLPGCRTVDEIPDDLDYVLNKIAREASRT